MIVYAQVNLANEHVCPSCRFSTFASLVNLFLPILIAGAAMIFLAMTLTASFHVLTAGGSAEKLAKAQKTFTYAIIGLLIVITSYLFVKLLGVILGFQTI